MGVTILSRTVSSVEDKRARVANAVFARKISIGNSWNKIRIGLRLSFEDSGANITGNPALVVGVCSGLTALYGEASVTNFAGVYLSAVQWNRGSGGSYAWYGATNSCYPMKKVGTTQTTGVTTITSSNGPWFGASPNLRDIYFVDILKGSPNYSFYCFWSNSLSDVTIANFKTQMEAATPVLADHFYSGPQTLAVDESAGNFDSICVHWNHTVPAMEISDFAICKLS